MDRELLFGETCLETIIYKDVSFELIQRPASLWTGVVGYAVNLTDEPDISGLLNRYQMLADVPKLHLTNPQWDACISIDYWRNSEAPRGMVFAQEVSDSEQDPRYDLYEMPASLYIRVACTKDSASKLLDKAWCEPWELYDFIREVMAHKGYTHNSNGAQEMEMYNHGAGRSYAYAPVTK